MGKEKNYVSSKEDIIKSLSQYLFLQGEDVAGYLWFSI